MCPCPGKTQFRLEQALTPLLTSSLLVLVFHASLLLSFEVPDYLDPPRRQGQPQGEESKEAWGHKGLEFRLLT